MFVHALLAFLVPCLDALRSVPSMSSGPVLVVGASGKVGRLIVSQLVSEGREVHAFVRDRKKSSAVLPENKLIKVFEGVINDEESLRSACRGCSAIVAVSGTVRFSKLADFLPWRFFGEDPMSWCNDESHPYFVNYKGIVSLVNIAEEMNIKRFVRLTGLSVGFSAFNPVTVLFNLLLSLTVKWNYRAEEYIRSRPGLDYTIVRPGGLSDDLRENLEPQPVSVQLEACGEGANEAAPRSRVVAPGRVGRSDVAALVVASLSHPNAARRVLACRWASATLRPVAQGTASDGSATWAEELVRLGAPVSPAVPNKPHMRLFAVAAALAPPLVLLVANLGAYAVQLAVRSALR